ncbi:unnamed protein product, partial [Coregonus sp. 'balchen']
FNSERYSRFTLQSYEERDGGSHVEVKLSDDVDDHTPSEQAGQPGGSPSYRPRPQQNYRNVCYLALGTLFIFIIGYLIGYVSHRSPRQEPIICDSEQEVGVAEEAVVESSLSWNDITSLLAQRLTPDAFNSRLSEKPNRVLIGQEELCQPKGYLAYSATGKAQGKAVYGNYGRQEDLVLLQSLKVELNGTVILLRATGQISLAQQVANVAALGVSAVLIFLDPKDYKLQPSTELYGHVHLGSGDPYTPGFPSFNHTQFPPTQSSGLPTVLAQSITAATAAKILTRIGGPESPLSFKGELDNVKYTVGGASSDDVTVEIDTWYWGLRGMRGVQATLKLLSGPHCCWSWLELCLRWYTQGYLSSLDRRAFTYISLDGVVTGHGDFKASASPLLYSLLESTMKEVKNPIGVGESGKSLYEKVSGVNFEEAVFEPMQMEDSAYPFLAFSGIPSLSFRFISQGVRHKHTHFLTNTNTHTLLHIHTHTHTQILCQA